MARLSLLVRRDRRRAWVPDSSDMGDKLEGSRDTE